MSLERYCHERCIALSARESAYAAARAMASNHVGAVVVYAQGRVAGLVTDRDLALRVVGGRRASDIELSHIMTSLPVTVSLDDEPEDAVELMRDMGVRRIPVLDGERLVGMVTLDDLLLSREVATERLAEVVDAQLSEPAPLKPAGVTHPIRIHRSEDLRRDREKRHQARSEQTLRHFTERLTAILGLREKEDALAAFEVVVAMLRRRLNATEAEHLAAQLPSLIRDRLLDVPTGPDRSITRETIERKMANRLSVDPEDAADLVSGVGVALREFVSAGELEHVRGQLPPDLRSLVGTPAQA